ncbi:hypothetical protein ACFSKU_10240 [Pontibacter silvestris]|uniref:TraB/GumN family protein n=1 Tax=Pontibacter silvestris TaxID=2305183 RepID=A0ABW4WX18_9BACT|nr:hypothetical protein [Pontibacter silvestris]MCC9136782.1 hypothetical protein [Pontibacter silvestris]
MKNLLMTLFTLLIAFYSFGQQKETEITVIGTIHQAASNFNPDTLYEILERIKPDIILIEIDSSFFTEDFRFKILLMRMSKLPLLAMYKDTLVL